MYESFLNYPKKKGKVRDIYDLGDNLLIVTTDRISAFDWVIPETTIPNKGFVLNSLSIFWFEFLGVKNHFITDNAFEVFEVPGRSMVVSKEKPLPVECIVRGYLAGSAWKDYQRTGKVCGIPLPAGLKENSRLPEPIFTPSTKVENGHDENIPVEEMRFLVGSDHDEIVRLSLEIYKKAAKYALSRGIIIADTKLEWGEGCVLIDEVLTPDSSRFWDASLYEEGKPAPSFDKQFVRDFLNKTPWKKDCPPPPLPLDVVEQTSLKYLEIHKKLV